MRVVSSASAPAAKGPYHQAVIHGDVVYCSGQLGFVPSTGQLVGDSTAAQTRQAILNLSEVLISAGSSLERVIKTTVFLVNVAEFPLMNAEYETYFGKSKPARTTVGVATLPLGAKVEIECIAAVGTN
jgi:2-iminobutanoate/2-iminopropanoate deaminase